MKVIKLYAIAYQHFGKIKSECENNHGLMSGE